MNILTDQPPQTDHARQLMLHKVSRAADRIGHDLLGLTVPVRAVLEAAAADGMDVSSAPEACRMIERVGASLQMLAATERSSITADAGAVYQTIQPLLRATLPRGVDVAADIEERCLINAGRESVAQAIFRCVHAVAASASPGDRVVLCLERESSAAEGGSVDLRFVMEAGHSGRSGPMALDESCLPGSDDPLLAALGASIESSVGDSGPTVVLTLPLAARQPVDAGR